jgi:hypothetical protein
MLLEKEKRQMTNKHTLRDVGKSLGLTWVEFNPKTGRHTFTRQMNRTHKIIGLNGQVIQEAGILTPAKGSHWNDVWEEYECYPDQINNGDLAYFVEHGLSQTGPRPCDEVEV